jgi:fructose/tagatose bisphosphate aldolase
LINWKFEDILDSMTSKKVRKEEIDRMVEKAYFSEPHLLKNFFKEIKKIAVENGIFPASLHNTYKEFGKRKLEFTVPAFNIRFLPYHTMRSIFRKAVEMEAGWFIMEIAKSEIGYTGHSPLMYSFLVLASALREGFAGPVFIQADHFQLDRKKFFENPDEEISTLKNLIISAIEADFYNIDIDASTLVSVDEKDPFKEQEKNGIVTAELTEFIRKKQPEGVTINIGGEIGEIGKKNSTPEDLIAFMEIYLGEIKKRGIKEGLTKISIQTGTKHGGFVLPDGSVAKIDVDFETIEKLSKLSKEKYGLGGVVQHGASTLPKELFKKFPEVGTLEIHLATEFQNILFNSRSIPGEIKKEMFEYIMEKFGSEKKSDETEEQFFYRMRKFCAGEFNKKLWNLPDENKEEYMEEIGEYVGFIFTSLGVKGTIRESRQIQPPRA